MRSTTLTAGFDPNFAHQRAGYRVAARRGAVASRRLQGGQHAVACSTAHQVAPRRSAEQILARHAPTHEPVKPAASEAIARRVLIAIRVAMGLVFVACGLSGFIDFTPAHAGTMHGGAMAFGGALLLAGSLLPLLKGTEVIVETILDLQRALSTRRTS
jgi:hypothetical protein